MLLLSVELLTFSEPVERVYTYSQPAWQLLQSAQHNSNTHVSSCCSLESWVMSYGHAQREWAIPLHQYPWNTNRACVSLILITTKKHLAVFSIFQDQIALGRMFPGEEPITGIGVCAEGKEVEPDSKDGGSVDMRANSNPLLKNDLHGWESAHKVLSPPDGSILPNSTIGRQRRTNEI